MKISKILMIGLGLSLAGCPGDDSSSSDTTTSTTDAATGAVPRPPEEPTTIEEWEELWAEQRAAVVKRIEDNGWGLQADGNTITGPEGRSS